MRKTKEEAAKTRNELMDSALKLFIKHGYSSVSLQQIVEEIDSTRGAFYWHFKTKEDILLAICHRERKFIEGLMTDLFATQGMNPLEHLHYILSALVNNFFNNKRFKDFIELTWFKLERVENDKVTFLKRIANEYFIEEITKILHNGIQKEVLKSNYPPQISALQIASIINGIYKLSFISPDYMTKDNAIAIVDQSLQSIRK